MEYSNRQSANEGGRWSVLLVLMLFLSGCASMDSLFSAQSTTDTSSQDVETEQQDSGIDASLEVVPLDPMQAKVLALRAATNLYLSGSTPVKASVKYQFDQALAAKQAGNLTLAKQILEKLIDDEPKLSGPWVQLGDLNMLDFAGSPNGDQEQKQAHLVAAKVNYEKAIKINQHNYFAHNRLAKVFREMGDFAQAEQHYQYAIQSYPAYDNAYLNLGILYDLYLGKKQQALENYELYQALQDKPKRQVRGWIADLKRQIAKVQNGENK
ncbi:tetratricopeptide repeat protein [Aliiglaciecola sp. SL4]|uniref:tetratricopeptide repeat protein n=1 Tax=Aliiglaciecola sp. SL4 TaxID=3239806 RepID=UPI00355C3082